MSNQNIVLITGASSEEVSDVADRVRREVLARVGLADLLSVHAAREGAS